MAKKQTDLWVQGENRKIRLTASMFLASGGQGEIFYDGNFVYKIYIDPKNMIPVSKIQELSVITYPFVISPIAALLDAKNNPVGYYMKYVPKDHTYILCQLFTKAFKDRNSINNDMILKIVQNLQRGISNVHSKKILLVDINELNFLVSDNFRDVFFIDVDSYQTPSFPATAIMESIKDRHSNKFSELTDWFSYGVITFQLWMGIHPYRGTHPTIKELDNRMLSNASVFDSSVRIPKICPPLSSIPQAYRDWYKAIFQEGKRLAPPFDAQAVVVITSVKPIIGSNQFIVKTIMNCEGEIVSYICASGNDIVLTSKGLYAHQKLDKFVPPSAKLAITPKNGHVIATWQENGNVKLYDARQRRFIDNNFICESITTYDGRIYIKNSISVFEIIFIELASGIQVTINLVAQVLPYATRLYDGVLIQNMLGSYYCSVFPKAGISYQIQLREIDGYKILGAKFDKGVLMIVGEKKGKYDRFVFRFDINYDSYDIKVIKDISLEELNFITLDNGLCVFINEKEQLEIFRAKKDSTDTKVIEDVISGDMKLFAKGTTIIFAEGTKLNFLTMKKF